MRAVRTDRFKLIDTVVGDTSRVRLFDVENDPHQTENLADDPAYADDVERLHAQLVAWRERQGDPMLPTPSTAG
jgi:arylsulfatase A-like enzyme